MNLCIEALSGLYRPPTTNGRWDHTDFAPDTFCVYHPRVHQWFGLDGPPDITNDTLDMPRAIFAVSYSVTWKGDLI